MKIKFLSFLIPLYILFFISCSSVKSVTVPATDIKTKAAFGPVNDTLLTGILARYPQYFDTVLQQKKDLNIQIIYTRIDRKNNGNPQLTHYYYNVDPARYFYPASTVKMPVALLALQKLNELKVAGLDKTTTFITESGTPEQTKVFNDATTPDGRPTIAHYIKKIFLVSDNDAYNRLYEFLGQEYINTNLHNMGYDSVQIVHRLSVPLTEAQNRTTNPVFFCDTTGRIIYRQPLVKSNMAYQKRTNLMGKGYYSGGKLVNAPFDFSAKNKLTLPDLHSMLQSVMFPETVNPKQRFNLTAEDYRFLYQHMRMYPRHSLYPSYDSSYTDAYVKFLLYGGKGSIDDNIYIFNKVGDAYGFLIDAAYVADVKNNIEFMLSATIHCNPDGIYNDDQYAYETIGFPFLKNLGQVIYDYEKNRERPNLPRFDDFLK